MGVFSRKESKKKQAAEAAPVVEDSDSDISLMTDSDLEGERAALRAELNKPRQPAEALAAAASDPFDQASLWAEVDREELERMAVNIARNALPPSASGEGAEAALRLNASAAATEKAELHNSADPLGCGRIDMRSLRLMREGAGAARQPLRYSAATSAGLLDAARRSQLAGRGRGGSATGDAAQEEAPSALRTKVLPGSETFDADLFLGTIHADTSLPELQRGLLALRQQLSEHTGQLKSLVKENFDRFISSKNTIDAVYAKLQKAEAEGEAGVHGASTGEVLEAVLQVQGEARRAFGPLLQRQAKADRIRLVLGVMKRYEAIVQLPSRVRQHAEAGDYEQVVADYRKAKALLGDQAPSPRPTAGGQQQQDGSAGVGAGSMWVKLMDEIDKVVGSVAHSLETVVRSASSAPGEAADAVRHILQLKAVGVAAAQHMDPVGLYVESQERHVRALLEAALQQHNARVDALRRQQQASADNEAQAASLASLGTSGSSAAASPATSTPNSASATPRTGSGEALAAAMEAAAVRYMATVTGAVCRWLPDYWALTQQQLPILARIGDAATAVERGMAAAERSVNVLLLLYRSEVQAVLSSPAAADLSHAGLLSIASELASGCQALRAPATAGPGGGSSSTAVVAPVAAVDCLQRLTEQTILASLAQLRAHLAAAVAQLCADEGFQLTPASRRLGAPATASVATLQRLVQEGMMHLKAALAEGARAGADPLRKSAVPARAVFFACFSAFAKGADAVAAALLPSTRQPGGGTAPSSSHRQQSVAAEAAAAAPASSRGSKEVHSLSPSRRLLVLCANLSVVRGRLLPQQYMRWAAVLQGGSGGKELQAAVQAAGVELEAVETRLAGAYIDRKQAVLDEAMEQLLFLDGTTWEAAPPPARVHPAALELVHAVVAIQAELAAVAPTLLHEALEELLLGTLDGFAQVLNQGAPPASPSGVLQLWLDATFLLAAVGGLGSSSEVLDQASVRLRAAADARLEAAAAAASKEDERLAAWLGGGQLTAQAARRRLQVLCEQAQADAQCNLAPLQQLGAPRQ